MGQEQAIPQFEAEGVTSEPNFPDLGAVNGGMRSRVDSFDWGITPLGPRAAWPSELEIVVQQILDSRFPKAIVWGDEFTTIFNDAFLPILGAKSDALGHSFADIWSEVWDEIGPIAARAYAGTPTYIEDYPLTINRSGRDERAWFTFCYSPLRLADGSVAGMMDTVIETTGKVLMQADLALVNQELGHRLKNTLALVQAIAAQTLRGAVDTDAMNDFSSRLSALGHAQDILLRKDWSRASLWEVISASLEPHNADGRIAIDGPDMQIGSRAAIAGSLMLHELATNAVKYGALSSPTGRIHLSWVIEDDHLSLHWRETGGPPAAEPQRKGFGTRLINMGMARGSRVRRRFDAEGFQLDVQTRCSELSS
ncbi:sensor histidine kinase [Sphingosinicella xenopeptidilytica]|uniref:histidine kinase n=1 Tax=Sphingosinicella xenopeptidilytica TaxID=364098 RepID=A0ABW3C735_SPHXN